MEKARDFFSIMWIIFVDDFLSVRFFCELARRLRNMLRKALIFNDLHRAAGRVVVSAWYSTA